MSMERMGVADFQRREIPAVEVKLEFETCQRKLIAQAEGRVVDPQADKHLIDQINGSVVEDEGHGAATLSCQTPQCGRICLVQSEMGVLSEVEARGVCIETATQLGRLSTR